MAVFLIRFLFCVFVLYFHTRISERVLFKFHSSPSYDAAGNHI